MCLDIRDLSNGLDPRSKFDIDLSNVQCTIVYVSTRLEERIMSRPNCPLAFFVQKLFEKNRFGEYRVLWPFLNC